MKYMVKSETTHSISIESESSLNDQFRIEVDGKPYLVQVKEYHPNGGIKSLVVNNKVLPIDILKQADGFPHTVLLNGLPFKVEVEKVKSISSAPAIETKEKETGGDIRCSLPGQVMTILVKKGDSVEKGQQVIILESMKMENEILAPKSGQVKKILVAVGQIVLKDELILQIS